jgi:hypothetical protein
MILLLALNNDVLFCGILCDFCKYLLILPQKRLLYNLSSHGRINWGKTEEIKDCQSFFSGCCSPLSGNFPIHVSGY